MSDARDILGVGAATSASASAVATLQQGNVAAALASVEAAAARKRAKARVIERKPEGINRELFSLMGGATPLVQNIVAFKEKPKFAKRTVPWLWKSFKNAARKDGFEFYHWEKKESSMEEYPFAQFNTSISIPSYTDEEYEKHLKSDEWTKEETDYLFSLCRQFDLRFPVVLDRYEYPNSNRTMEDLRERYYSIISKLITIHSDLSDPAVQAELEKSNYNKQREIDRKKQLEILLRRTMEEVQEEEMLLAELRRIEQNNKKVLKEREQAIQLLSTIDSRFPKQSLAGSASQSRFFSRDKHAAASSSAAATASSPSTPAQATPSPAPNNISHLLDDKVKYPRKKEKIPPGVYARSTKIGTLLPTGPKTMKKLDQFFLELEANCRPTVPTAETVNQFETLRGEVQKLIELKKLVDKREYENQILQQRKNQLLGIPTTTTPGSESVTPTPESRKRGYGAIASTPGDKEPKRLRKLSTASS